MKKDTKPRNLKKLKTLEPSWKTAEQLALERGGDVETYREALGALYLTLNAWGYQPVATTEQREIASKRTQYIELWRLSEADLQKLNAKHDSGARSAVSPAGVKLLEELKLMPVVAAHAVQESVAKPDEPKPEEKKKYPPSRQREFLHLGAESFTANDLRKKHYPHRHNRTIEAAMHKVVDELIRIDLFGSSAARRSEAAKEVEKAIAQNDVGKRATGGPPALAVISERAKKLLFSYLMLDQKPNWKTAKQLRIELKRRFNPEIIECYAVWKQRQLQESGMSETEAANGVKNDYAMMCQPPSGKPAWSISPEGLAEFLQLEAQKKNKTWVQRTAVNEKTEVPAESKAATRS